MPLSRPPSAALLLVIPLAAFVASAFSPRDLWAPDEPRYGQVAREMLEHGDGLVPHVNREPYPEKPPLWFWMVAGISGATGGVTPVTARIVGALLAAGAVLLTMRLGRRFFGDAELGCTAALVFASTGIVLWNAPRAALDLPLTFFVLLAVEQLSAWLATGRVPAALLGGVGWGAAVLVKGPVGFLLPPLVLAGGALFSRRAPRWANAGWWLAPSVMAIVVLAWLLPAIEAGGAAYTDRLLGQLGARATGAAEEGHVRGPAYYVLRAGPLVLPWTLHLLAGLAVFRSRRRRPAKEGFGIGACLAGSAGLLLLLSLFATKRELYFVPALPFASLLAAAAIHYDIAPRLRLWGRWLAVLCLAGMAGGVALAPWLLPRFAAIEGPEGRTVVAALLAALGLAAATVWTFRRRAEATHMVRGAAVFLLLGAAVVHVVLLPPLDAVKSFGPLARAAETASEGGEILAAGWRRIPNLLWRLPRDRVGTLEGLDDVAACLARQEPVSIVIERPYWEGLLERARTEARVASAELQRTRVAWEGRVGHRTLLVLSNR